jgi:hypothetical protein
LSPRVQALVWFACACVYATSCESADTLGPLLACRGIAEEAARLACFDRESAALTAISAASAAAAKTAPSPADPKQNFGLPDAAVAKKEVAAGTRAADASNIDAHIAALSVAGNGRNVFTLDNGQIWLQLLTEGDLLLKPGDAVKISRAAFGSYWLQTQLGRGCKVTRIR